MILCFVLVVISYSIILGNASTEFKKECEEYQRLLPAKTNYECFNVTRYDDSGEEYNDTSVKCTCAWFENCRQHLRNDPTLNETIYVAGMRVETFYKCCWSRSFSYDLETCSNVTDVSKIENVNDGTNVTIVVDVRKKTHYLICDAHIEEKKNCIGAGATVYGSEDSAWVAALVIGLVIPLALIQTCDPIDPPLHTIVTYSTDPNGIYKYDLGTTATYQCEDPTTQTVLYPNAIATCITPPTGFEDLVPGYPDAALCCINQYASCSAGTNSCCSGNKVSADFDGVCNTAEDGLNYCSIGTIGDTCGTGGSTSECVPEAYCSGNSQTCEKYCAPINTVIFTTVYDSELMTISTQAGDVDVAVGNTLATLTCPVGTQLPAGIPDYTATCTDGEWLFTPSTELTCCIAQYYECTGSLYPCCNGPAVNTVGSNAALCTVASDNVDRCSVGDVNEICDHTSTTIQCELDTRCYNNRCRVTKICPSTTNYCYTISANKLTHPNALSSCEAQGGTLATVPNEDINTQLYNMGGGVSVRAEGIYIGLRGNLTVWTWQDGATLDYVNWNAATNEPNTKNATYNCGTLVLSWNGKWNDNSPGCKTTAVIKYFCQFRNQE